MPLMTTAFTAGCDRVGIIQQMESQISSLSQKVQAKEEQQTTEMDRLKLAHGNEVEQL